MVPSELTGEVSMGVLLVFLVFWRWGRYIVPDQQGDIDIRIHFLIPRCLGTSRCPDVRVRKKG